MSEKFDQELNQDYDGYRTPARREGDKWVIDVEDVGTIRGLSTDTKPTNAKKGLAFFEIDTTDVYMFDGSQWRLI